MDQLFHTEGFFKPFLFKVKKQKNKKKQKYICKQEYANVFKAIIPVLSTEFIYKAAPPSLVRNILLNKAQGILKPTWPTSVFDPVFLTGNKKITTFKNMLTLKIYTQI